MTQLLWLQISVSVIFAFAVGAIWEMTKSGKQFKAELAEIRNESLRELILFKAAMILGTAVPSFDIFDSDEIVDPSIIEMRREMAASLFRMSEPVREYVPREGDTIAQAAVDQVSEKVHAIQRIVSGVSIH